MVFAGDRADDPRQESHRGAGVATVERGVADAKSLRRSDHADDVVADTARRSKLFHDLRRRGDVHAARQSTDRAFAVGQGAYHQGPVRRALIPGYSNLPAQSLEMFDSGATHCSSAT